LKLPGFTLLHPFLVLAAGKGIRKDLTLTSTGDLP
jgi:hypothetical protein